MDTAPTYMNILILARVTDTTGENELRRYYKSNDKQEQWQLMHFTYFILS